MLFHPTILNKKDEDSFIESLMPDAILYYRLFCIFSVILFPLLGLVDIKVQADNIAILQAIRFYILLPLLLIAFALSFTQILKQLSQVIPFLTLLIAGAGAAAIVILDPASYVNYGMIFLVLLAGYFVLRLKMRFAVIGCWLTTAAVIGGLLIADKTGRIELIAYAVLLVAANAMGMSGSYYIGDCQRKSFLMRQQSVNEKKHLERMMSEKVKEITDSQTVTIFALAKLSESRDKETGNHIERVGKYCQLIASRIDEREYEKRGISKEDFVSRIELASALHDIGKVGVGDAILIKPGRLSAEEFEIMTCHTLIGSNTLDEVRKKYPNNSFINMGIEITRYHHEKYDGSGYPYGLSGEKIPLSARIMAIADVYDALISVRPYKPAYTHDRAMDIITNLSGQQFDPMLIKIFEECNRDIKGIAYGHQHPF